MPDPKDLGLRDWLAGQALNGILANPDTPEPPASLPFPQHAQSLAQQAYAYADAMMRERGRSPESEQG